MKGIVLIPGIITGLITLGMILPASSQVTSDGTTNTTVNQSGNNFNIINGIKKGNNLFHSFKEFSIPTGSFASFNHSTDVLNILNRVTGGNISNTDGLIKSSGNANLFLINPARIVFGENAKLDIGGSFLGSTAESILFEDILRNGSQISATAGGTGNGGSIDIKAPFIIGVKSENSNITANAFKGNGGNINITTQEIFGLTFRDQLTEESDITASSQFGINGTVKINNIGIDSIGIRFEY